MRVRKIWMGTMTAVAVVGLTFWASVASAAINPADVDAALSKEKTPAQQQAEIEAMAVAAAGNQADFEQLVGLVAAKIPKDLVVAMTRAMAAACNTSGNNAQTSQALINGIVLVHPEAGGAAASAAIDRGCLPESIAAAVQNAYIAAAGMNLLNRIVVKEGGDKPGVNPFTAEPESKTVGWLWRLGDSGRGPFLPIQEGVQSPTRIKDKGPEYQQPD